MPSPLIDLFKNEEVEKNVLQFPSNLGSKEFGHYVMFKIKATDPEPIIDIDFFSFFVEIAEKAVSVFQESDGAMEGAGRASGVVAMGVATTAVDSYTQGSKFFTQEDVGQGGYLLRRTLDPEYIALYLPATIQNNQSAKYNDVEMGNVISLLSRDINTGNVGDLVTKFAAKKAKSSLGAEFASLGAAYEIKSGKVANNQIESVFETIDRRTFQFDFKMIPRNLKEAQNIRDIVKKFRSHMAPSIDNPEQPTFMTVPSLFEISFFNRGKENFVLPRIQESVCVTCNVVYGGERVSFFSDKTTEGFTNHFGKGNGEIHPIETSMTLTFQEMQIITKEKILREGY